MVSCRKIISPEKTPGSAGGLTEFDSSGNMSLSPLRNMEVLTLTDCDQAPLRGQQS
jgi:hypothetical protein